jgi:hypothetical protein
VAVTVLAGAGSRESAPWHGLDLDRIERAVLEQAAAAVA